MDTLIGALRQSGLSLDQGVVLLDKWVKVSRFASVGIDTLAESFAITAAAASSAGVDVDELNGIIALLAESTTLSATEAGNAVRAFIGGFTTDTAIKELGALGVAVIDVNGDARGFLDVIKQINAMWEAGIISDTQLAKVDKAMAGGVRREAQIITGVKNKGKTQEV